MHLDRYMVVLCLSMHASGVDRSNQDTERGKRNNISMDEWLRKEEGDMVRMYGRRATRVSESWFRLCLVMRMCQGFVHHPRPRMLHIGRRCARCIRLAQMLPALSSTIQVCRPVCLCLSGRRFGRRGKCDCLHI
jgi:hypothetical protein